MPYVIRCNLPGIEPVNYQHLNLCRLGQKTFKDSRHSQVFTLYTNTLNTRQEKMYIENTQVKMALVGSSTALFPTAYAPQEGRGQGMAIFLLLLLGTTSNEM